jgi:SAM-dependent methyltransferase
MPASNSSIDPNSAFWATQSTSMHRSDDKQIYEKKAVEHAALIRAEDRDTDLVDLGCGAGELLVHFSKLVRVTTGFDISKSMLDAARAVLPDADIQLVQGNDVLAFIASSPHAVWTTTGAVNQFLDMAAQRRLLDAFASHPRARAYYMFDCVDPIRYSLLAHGISYRPVNPTLPLGIGYVKHLLRRLSTAGRIAAGARANTRYLGSAAMGWGQLPRFWLVESQARGLEVEIVSSRHYEYRYHVLLHKPRVAHG